MTAGIIFKAASIWFILALLAMVNGLFRDNVLVPSIGQSLALPVSGIVLCTIIFAATFISFPIFGNSESMTYLLIGMQWVLMTLIFEFVFGHYVFGKSWLDILQVFNVMKGNLFIMVLLASLVSPILVAKIKGVA
ncbi:MAG: hypothetical protein KJN89_03495 [Gammaproteobacteria bacterium]|nr:hypothetical protein [Gammaproteobacteria bacterium]NNJ49416.1 hypothetical protein [Gammaproteobacteria bacterium]